MCLLILLGLVPDLSPTGKGVAALLRGLDLDKLIAIEDQKADDLDILAGPAIRYIEEKVLERYALNSATGALAVLLRNCATCTWRKNRRAFYAAFWWEFRNSIPAANPPEPDPDEEVSHFRSSHILRIPMRTARIFTMRIRILTMRIRILTMRIRILTMRIRILTIDLLKFSR
jgi:hypothetical protein